MYSPFSWIFTVQMNYELSILLHCPLQYLIIACIERLNMVYIGTVEGIFLDMLLFKAKDRCYFHVSGITPRSQMTMKLKM